MAFLTKVALAGGGIAAALLTSGFALSEWPLGAAPAGAAVLPVLAKKGSDAPTISVCMYPGARPQSYSVLQRVCPGGADTCTAFVAVQQSEAEILVAGYDISNPPVEATGSVCDRPVFIPSGAALPTPSN